MSKSVGPAHNSHGLSNIRQVTVVTYNTLGFVTTIRADYTYDQHGNKLNNHRLKLVG